MLEYFFIQFLSFFFDAFIVHAFFQKTILFEKHLLISYILGTSFIHMRRRKTVLRFPERGFIQ